MPRRSAHSKKGGSSRSAKKPPVEEEGQGDQDVATGKSLSKDSEGERSRRSSTAAQTAASVAESRVTRTRTSRQDSSPSDSRRGGGQDVEATRVRSSRRNASRVNYKESDGEEEAPTPKNEENFDSNDDFEESDSDEKSQTKGKRAAKSPAKSRAAAGKPKKGKGKGASRGRPPKKKVAKEEDEDDEDEDEKPIYVSDDSDSSLPKAQDDKGTESKTPLKSESEGKPSRKSSRGSLRSKTETPVSKRPSRNKQIKKYTEVDEDFDDEEEVSAVEVKSEEGKKSEAEKRGSSRKRKRETESESNKRPKKEQKVEEVDDDSESSDCSPSDRKGDAKSSEGKGSKFEDEPMEVDDATSDSENEDTEKKGVRDEKTSEKGKQEATNKPTISISEDSSSMDKDETSSMEEKNHIQKSESEKQGSQVEPGKADVPPESRDNTPGVIKSVEKEMASSMASEGKSDIKRAQKQENTFLSKGQGSETDVSMNGGEKAREKNSPEKGFLFQNSGIPKANGEADIASNLSPSAEREYIANQSLGIDFLRRLKGNSVRFGFASYNLSTVASPKEKLLRELDKEVSIVCLQNVSRSVYQETLESFFHASGYKAVVNWLPECESGLVTLYKTSLFKVEKVEDTSIRKLIQRKSEFLDLDENERRLVSENLDRCGYVLITQLSVCREECAPLTIANVKIPSSTASFHALQLVCLNQELAELAGRSSSRIILCGEFNATDTDVPYQLLRNNRPSGEVLEGFKTEVDSVQNAAILKMLRNILHRPSVKLNSCYAMVLGHELKSSESKGTSPDLLWISADSIHTIGIDLPSNHTEKLNHGQVPLKADIAITLPSFSNTLV